MRESTMERHATLGYALPTEPGLGLEINEEALKAQPPFKHWCISPCIPAVVWLRADRLCFCTCRNPPFLRRKDGSLTNW